MKYNELCAALISECEPDCVYVAKISSNYFSEIYGSFGVYEDYEIFEKEGDSI